MSTTKFNVGDTLWLMHNNKPKKSKVIKILIEDSVNYCFGEPSHKGVECDTGIITEFYRDEDNVSKTIEGLLSNLQSKFKQ